jgi:glycine hydroxymethyltransferase
MKEKQMDHIVELIDAVITDPENELSLKKIRKKVHKLMYDYPLYRENGSD